MRNVQRNNIFHPIKSVIQIDVNQNILKENENLN